MVRMYSIVSSKCVTAFTKKKHEKMGKFGNQLTEQLGSVATGGIGAVAGMGLSMLDEALFGNKRRKQQLEQQQKLTNMQVAGNKELMDLGHKQQMQMWEDTNYAAQREQLRKAGLNPAMIYGGGGEGGTTGAGAVGSASAGTAEGEVSRKMADTQQQAMGLQLRKEKAEIEVMEAQAENLKAEAKKKGGVDTEKTEWEITNLQEANRKMSEEIEAVRQETKNKQVIRASYLLENSLKEMQNKIVAETMEQSIWSIRNNALKAGVELDNLLTDREIKNSTKEAIIETVKTNAKHAIAQMLLTEAKTELTEEQAWAVGETIIQTNRKLGIDEQNTHLKEKFPSVGSVSGRILNGILELGNDIMRPIDKWLGTENKYK